MDESFAIQVSNELSYFINKKRISLFSPVSQEEIEVAEKKLGCKFSPQMRSFLQKSNGGRVFEIRINGVQSIGIKKIPKFLDIVESNISLRALHGWQSSWLHIGEDGFGNYFVVDTNRILENGEYPVLFVDHEEVGNCDASTPYANGYSDFIIKIINEMKRVFTCMGEIKSINNNMP